MKTDKTPAQSPGPEGPTAPFPNPGNSISASVSHSPEQAKDLTQDFFAAFLEKNSVARAVRERGRFRSFLMTSVANFLHDAHHRNVTQKRGGGRCLVSLDELDAEAYYSAQPAHQLDPAK